MLNIHELEIRHRKYKLKSYIPYITIILLLTLIFISTFLLFNNKDITVENSDKKNFDTPISNKIEDNTKTDIVEKKNVTIQKIDEKTIVNEKESLQKTSLSPSMNFMNKISSAKVDNNEQEVELEMRTEKVHEEIAPIKKKVTKAIKDDSKKLEVVEINEVKSKKINITKDDQDIQHVIKRFNNNNNPALSLFIAKKYYKIGEYHKAYNYSLITNEINHDIEESWIIFAKSLVKLEEKNKAISTLKKYIDKSHSSQARILLNEIESGKFK